MKEYTSTAQSDEDVVKLLLGLERKLMDPQFRKERAEATELLAEEFFEFGASGRVWTREEILAPSEQTGLAVTVEDFTVRMLAPGLAQATYRSMRTVAGCAPFVALRCSLWRFQEGRWQMLFHQGTKVPDA